LKKLKVSNLKEIAIKILKLINSFINSSGVMARNLTAVPSPSP